MSAKILLLHIDEDGNETKEGPAYVASVDAGILEVSKMLGYAMVSAMESGKAFEFIKMTPTSPTEYVITGRAWVVADDGEG